MTAEREPAFADFEREGLLEGVDGEEQARVDLLCQLAAGAVSLPECAYPVAESPAASSKRPVAFMESAGLLHCVFTAGFDTQVTKWSTAMKPPEINLTPLTRSSRVVNGGAAAASRSHQQRISEEVAMRSLHTSGTDGPDSAAAVANATERRGCCAKDAVRIGFGVIWLIDAALKWQPGFRANFMSTLMGEAQGQPSWLRWWFHLWINIEHPQPTLWAYLAAGTETVIALALIFGFARKATYIGAILFSLLIWSTAEGFGGPYTSSSTDIGTAVIYAVVFAALLALNYEAGPSRFSVDYLIEQRVPWWHRVAEVERRRRKTAPARQSQQPLAQTSA